MPSRSSLSPLVPPASKPSHTHTHTQTQTHTRHPLVICQHALASFLTFASLPPSLPPPAAAAAARARKNARHGSTQAGRQGSAAPFPPCLRCVSQRYFYQDRSPALPPPPPPFPRPYCRRCQSRGALLSSIQQGTKLKKAVTNDRSQPIIDGAACRAVTPAPKGRPPL